MHGIKSIPQDPESNVLIKRSHMNDESDERTVEVNVFEDDSDSTFDKIGHDVSHRDTVQHSISMA